MDDHSIKHRLDLVFRLYKAYAGSAGTYASQVWSTKFWHPDRIFDSEAQSQTLANLRFLIKTRRSTCRWSMLHELGQKPLQFQELKAGLTFWNKMLNKNWHSSGLLYDVVQSDRDLATKGCQRCWTAQVKEALLGFGCDEADKLMNLQAVDTRKVLKQVADKYNAFWT